MQLEGQARRLRTRVYIDGYNFYYGCLKGSPHKWLDLHKLFADRVLPSILVKLEGQPAEHVLLPEAIQYFTAKIIERAAKADDSVSSQARYHTALRRLYDGRIRIVEGYYSVTKVRAPRVDENAPEKWPRDCDRVAIWKLEEKQTDVNLALHAYHDALTDQIDQAVIVSNDTDLVPALRMIRANTPVKIGLVIPTRNQERRPNKDLAEHCHWVRGHLTDDELAASELPRVIRGGRSPTTKPDSWYPHPELFQQALTLATSVCGSRQAAFKWFDKQSPYFDEKSPMDVWATEDGAKQVITYMKQWIAEHDPK